MILILQLIIIFVHQKSLKRMFQSSFLVLALSIHKGYFVLKNYFEMFVSKIKFSYTKTIYDYFRFYQHLNCYIYEYKGSDIIKATSYYTVGENIIRTTKIRIKFWCHINMLIFRYSDSNI